MKHSLRLLGVLFSLFWALPADSGSMTLLHAGGSGGAVGNMKTPVFSIFGIPAANTATYYGGVVGTSAVPSDAIIATSTAVRRVPIPIAGTISKLYTSLGYALGSTGATITDNINGTNGTVGCTTGLSTPYTCNSASASDTVSAGDIFQWGFNPNATTWSTGHIGQLSSILTAANGQQGAILSFGGSIASTATYSSIGSAINNAATELQVSGIFSVPGQITAIYAVPNGSDNSSGDTHIFTIYHNGAAAASMSCSNPTPTVNPTAGCCADVTSGNHIGGGSGPACSSATAIPIAVGDTISISITCSAGTCATISPGTGIAWAPTNANQAPLFSANFVNVPITNEYWGVSDGVGLTTQTAFQMVPLVDTTATFSNLIACEVTSPGGSATRTATLQSGASPLTAPTTPGSGPAVIITASTTCPGALSGTIPYGAQDTTHTLTTNAGYTLDNLTGFTGSPAASGDFKMSIAVTVP